jgi:hypothetical protein
VGDTRAAARLRPHRRQLPKGYRAANRQKVMTLTAGEFIRRFLIHVLPQGFHRIRHYGLFASGTRPDNIARARRLLDTAMAQSKTADATTSSEPEPQALALPTGREVTIDVEAVLTVVGSSLVA